MRDIKCPHCGSRDYYYPTNSGVDNCTECEEIIAVGSNVTDLKDDIDKILCTCKQIYCSGGKSKAAWEILENMLKHHKVI